MLRALREDLITGAAQSSLPLLKGRRARWLPNVAIVACALWLVWSESDHLMYAVHVPESLAYALAIAETVPLMLAMSRPIVAWWMSIAASTLVSLIEVLTSWAPWPQERLLTHLGVLILAALRVRPRTMAGLWLLSMMWAGLLHLQILASGRDGFRYDLTFMGVLSATVMIVIASLRGRTEARRQLVAQTHMTAAERSRRTVLEERTRIARELHDVVAHHMSVIAIQAEAAPYRVPDPPDALVTSFAAIRENAVQALSELRRVLGVLRAEGLEDSDREQPQPTLARLDELVANARAAGLAVDTTVTGVPQTLPHGVELSAFRILQEALSNAMRHAPGSTVLVEVAYVLGGVGLRVLNGPPGAPPVSDKPGTGHGVLGMRERASMLRGELEAGPTPDGGYQVTAFLPTGWRTAETEDA
jgi:signal transduction histidine kinase